MDKLIQQTLSSEVSCNHEWMKKYWSKTLKVSVNNPYSIWKKRDFIWEIYAAGVMKTYLLPFHINFTAVDCQLVNTVNIFLSSKEVYVSSFYSITCNVVMCLSLNLFSTYLRTNDVFPTHPSPRSTHLNEKLRPPESAILIIRQ